VDAICEAKVERYARAATQSLALLTEVPRRRVLGSMVPSDHRTVLVNGCRNALEKLMR
jgi:hypothetical protein